jgi:hypothetical protein
MSNPLITLRGTAKHPWLNTPDTKFKPEGHYKMTLEVDAETAAPIVEKFERMRDIEVTNYNAAKKGKAKAKPQDLPIAAQTDDEGNETGMYELKVKMIASGVTKAGKAWARKLPLFDGQGKPTNAQVGGGSEVNVSFEPAGWTNAKGECSVTCRLEAVQVLRLSAGGQSSASRFGFGAVDGAYVSADEPAEKNADTSDDDGSDETSYDFS